MATKQTDARKALAKNLKRTRALQLIFEAGSLKPTVGQRRGSGQPSNEERELLRAVVVFAIGALDAYLSDVAAEVLVAQLESAVLPAEEARNLLSRVTKEVPTLSFELALTTDRAQRRKAAKRAISDHLTTRVSNHGPKGVAETMRRLNTEIDFAAINMAQFSKLETSDRKGAADVLQWWTDKRHDLVHRGTTIQVSMEQSSALIGFVEALADCVEAKAVATLS